MRREPLSQRLYRRLLALFPVDFRAEYREEMEELFRLQSRQVAGSRRRLARLWLRAVADLLRSAPREHADALGQDLRYTVRTMRRAPAFSGLVIATFALAVGVNAAVFTVAHATLLRPLPFADEERLVRLVDLRHRPDGSVYEGSVSRRNFQAVSEQAESFEAVTAQVYQGLALRTGDGVERVTSIGVSGSWFRTLGLRPAFGSSWSPEEEAQGRQARLVLLSDHLWRRHLGGRPDVVGSRVVLDGVPHVVLGVMPRGLSYPYETDLWRLWDFPPEEEPTHNLNVQARLAPGVSLDAARSELERLSRRLAEAFPDTNEGYVTSAVPTRENLLEGGERTVIVLLLAAGCVLLIAAVDVLGLLMARTVSRAPELALRASLGASVWRRSRQLATENVVLALAGGALGVVLAAVLREPLAALVPNHAAEFYGELPFGAPVLLFGLAASLAVGVAVGAVAGWTSRRIDVRGVLQGGSGSPARLRLLERVVVGETALAALLVVAAVLLGSDLYRLASRDPGLEPQGLVATTLSLPADEYAPAAARVRFLEELLEAVEAEPGVEAAAVVNLFPYEDGNVGISFFLEGEAGSEENAQVASLRTVSPGYFDTLGIPLLRGRALSGADRRGAPPVALVNRGFAERYWPGEEAVGRRVVVTAGALGRREIQVVGVAGDLDDPHLGVPEVLYVPLAQAAEDSSSWDVLQPTLAVRAAGVAAGDAPAVAPAVRSALARLDPGVPFFDLRTAAEARAAALGPRRAGAALALAAGGLGLLLAVLGTYGVLAYTVSRRTRDFGVRLALGASRGSVLRRVLGLGGRLVGTGIGVGLAAAFLLAPWLGDLLATLAPRDGGAYLAVAALLAVSGVVASLAPALRATRADPAAVLRDGER